ncbi:MAG TPA: AsmA family protein [Burkholderiaceae bacterium]|nr:AsmA family protein [Burkholderiaceae bacterium]
MKRVAVAAAAALVLVLAALAVFVASFDVNRFKPDIVQAVQARTGRTLHFDGDLTLALFPSIGIKLPATTLSERGSDAPFAQLASAQASVALLPLLGGHVEIDALRVDGLRATIVRQADGSTNIDDLLGKSPPAPASTTDSGKGGGAKASAAIGEVRLRNADLTWQDLAAKRTVRLANLDLQFDRYAPGVRMPLEGSADVSVDDPPLAAKVTIDVEFAWAEDGTLAGVYDLALKADGRFRERPMKLDMRAEQLVAARDAWDVRQLKGGLDVETGGGPLEVRLTAPRFAVSPKQATGERIELSARRGGDSPLEFTLAIAAIQGNAAQLETNAVKITGQARSGDRRLAVEGALPLAANVAERTARIEQGTLNVVMDDPALAQKSIRLPLVVVAAVDGRRETATVQLESRAEGLNGRARIDLAGFDAKHVTFDIDAAQVDVDRYLPARPAASGASSAPAATGPSAPAATGPSAPAAASTSSSADADAKVDLSALREASGSGSVRIARLKVRGVEAADVRLEAKASDGRIDVAPISAHVYGGSVTGRIGIDTRANHVSATGNATGVQLRSAVGKIGARAAIEGSANGTFELATSGATTKQMKRGLAGNVVLDVRNGALVGIDLNDIVGSAGSFLQTRSRQTGVFDERKRTEFTQLTGSARIKDGVALNDDLKAQTKTLVLTGGGRIDLAADDLDYTLRTQVTALPAGSPNALRSLTGLTIPVRISGQLDHLGYSIDWTSVAAQALLLRATGGVGAPAVDKVIEGLGGLIGRGKKK